MESIFKSKRINISDLVNPYDQVVLNKKFISCELIGPANILIIFNNSKFISNNFEQSDAVEIRNDVVPRNAVAFAGCDFENCRFFKVSMLFQSSSREAADSLISNMNWLTAVDEPKLALEEKSNEQKGFGGLIRRLSGRL